MQSKVKIEAAHMQYNVPADWFPCGSMFDEYLTYMGRRHIPSDEMERHSIFARLKGRCRKIKDVKC